MKHLTLAASLALILAAPLTASAQEADHSAHAGHAMSGSESASTMAYMEANAKMHAGMDIPFTGDADVDFIRGMIAHHQGAVDAARVVLEFGTDATVRAFAQGVIDAQEAEIAWMQDWLAQNGE